MIGAIAKMVSYIYRRCDTLPVQSERFRESILQKGAFEERIVYAPNWAEDIFTDRSHADREKYRNLIPSGFVVMFAGNIGEAQDFKSLMQAAALTREHRDIKWVIVGDGRKREYVERRIAQEGLSETVRMLGRFPVEHMPHLFVHADAMLVSLKKEYIFSLTIPSKTQAYMAFGKPVLTMIDGAGNDVIESARCGLCARAGDYEHLAENVLAMSRLSAEQREQMGQRGAEYYREHFEKSRVIDTLERIIIDTNRHET